MGKNNLQIFSTRAMPIRYQGKIDEIVLAYETYGEMSETKDNAVLIIHGFSANSHIARHDEADDPGWWEWAVGPGLPLDTDRYFIVCANNLGSCFGTSGPGTLDKKSTRPIASDFPFPSIADIVFCQHELQQELGIEKWLAVIGGSLGGMAALQWVASYPGKVQTAVCLNAGARVSHTGYGMMKLQSEMIKQDTSRGLFLARQLATIAYLDEAYFQQIAGSDPAWRLSKWLESEAEAFSIEFNPYSYRGFLHAMTEFDCSPAPSCFTPAVVIVGCAEDKLFPPSIIQETAERFVKECSLQVIMVHSKYGHDVFLLDEPLYTPILKNIFSVIVPVKVT